MDEKSRLSLFIFIDALGWELIHEYAFMEQLLPERYPLTTIFGYSSTCHPTILTGQLPREHEHFSFFYYNPEDSPFRMLRILDIFPKSLTSRGRVRHQISKFFKRFYGYTGYFQLYNMPFKHLHLFDYSEKRSLYEPGGINSGAPTILDFLKEHRIPYSKPNYELGERKGLEILEADVTAGMPAYAYCYLGRVGRGAPQARQNRR